MAEFLQLDERRWINADTVEYVEWVRNKDSIVGARVSIRLGREATSATLIGDDARKLYEQLRYMSLLFGPEIHAVVSHDHQDAAEEAGA